jgi:hypothetical protein
MLTQMAQSINCHMADYASSDPSSTHICQANYNDDDDARLFSA